MKTQELWWNEILGFHSYRPLVCERFCTLQTVVVQPKEDSDAGQDSD